nr:hypothetical protein [Tanacetum cinerariifolium]
SDHLANFDGKADEGYIVGYSASNKAYRCTMCLIKGRRDYESEEQRATSDAERLGLGFAKDAEELQKRASATTVPPGSIPVPSGDTMVSTDDV